MRKVFSKCLIGLALLILLPSLAAGAGDIPSWDVDNHNAITSWLICGPFDNPLKAGVKEYTAYRDLAGQDIDYLRGESTVNPTEGLRFTASDGGQYEWKLYQAPDTGIMDLKALYADNRFKVAYAACRLTSDADKEVWLGVGSDDGVKIWLNGKLVWWHQIARGVLADDDLVKLDVKKGSNMLLIKIDQATGGWGFCARTVDKPWMAEHVLGDMPKKEPVFDVEVEQREGGLRVMVGRLARLRILGEQYTVAMRDGASKPVWFGAARLGEELFIPCTDLKPGPYWLDCIPNSPFGPNFFHYQLGYGRRLWSGPGTGIFYHHGQSAVSLQHFGRDGAVSDLPVMLVDSKFTVVKNAFADDVGAVPEHIAGVTRVLRTDVSPFRIQVLIDSPSLGRRWLLADNEGRGYTAPASGEMTLNLPLEAARSMRARIQRRLAEFPDLPEWLKNDLQRRVNDTAELSSGSPSPAQVYAMLDKLCEVKNRLPSEGPISVWSASSIDKVSKTEAVPEYAMDAAHVSLAKNEYEPFQIVLRSDQPMNGLTVEFEAPTASDGSSIKTSNLDTKLVEYVDIEETTEGAISSRDPRFYWQLPSFGTTGLWPDPLPPIREPFALVPGENRALWVTVHTPGDQKAGVYRGALKVMAGKKLVARAPFEVQVFDFALPDETSTGTIFGVSAGGYAGDVSPYHGTRTPEQERAVYELYMKECASHRVAPFPLPPDAEITTTYQGNPQHPVLDFTNFDKVMTRYLDEYKFNNFCFRTPDSEMAGNKMFTPEYNRLFREKWTAVQEHLREKGWLKKACWYWFDEPGADTYPAVKQGMELLKWGCPDIRRLLTFYGDPAPVPYFNDAVNLWVPLTYHENADKPDGDNLGYNAELAHARQALGEEVWWYTCNLPIGLHTNFFIDRPTINYRIHFWLMDKYDVQGFLYWATTGWTPNPWIHPMTQDANGGMYGNGAGQFLYPPFPKIPLTPQIVPPVTSIRFEAVRDGLEDLEYLLMLRKASQAGGQAAIFAGRVLESAHSDLGQSMTCYEQNAALLLAARESAGRAVEGSKAP